MNDDRAFAVDAACVDIGTTPILRNVGLAANYGEWLGLCGANGAGKTTLIRAIAGRLPLRTGAIRLNREDAPANRLQLANVIGFPVNGDALPASLRVGDVLTLLSNREPGLASVLIERLRDALGLDSVLQKQVGGLSSGWRQRLSIYSAFMPLRRIIVLDEPFNWLDPLTAYQIKTLLRCFADEGFAIISCEHDLSTVVYKCDRAIFMAEGCVRAEFDSSALAAARADFIEFETRLIALMSGSRTS